MQVSDEKISEAETQPLLEPRQRRDVKEQLRTVSRILSRISNPIFNSGAEVLLINNLLTSSLSNSFYDNSEGYGYLFEDWINPPIVFFILIATIFYEIIISYKLKGHDWFQIGDYDFNQITMLVAKYEEYTGREMGLIHPTDLIKDIGSNSNQTIQNLWHAYKQVKKYNQIKLLSEESLKYSFSIVFLAEISGMIFSLINQPTDGDELDFLYKYILFSLSIISILEFIRFMFRKPTSHTKLPANVINNILMICREAINFLFVGGVSVLVGGFMPWLLDNIYIRDFLGIDSVYASVYNSIFLLPIPLTYLIFQNFKICCENPRIKSKINTGRAVINAMFNGLAVTGSSILLQKTLLYNAYFLDKNLSLSNDYDSDSDSIIIFYIVLSLSFLFGFIKFLNDILNPDHYTRARFFENTLSEQANESVREHINVQPEDITSLISNEDTKKSSCCTSVCCFWRVKNNSVQNRQLLSTVDELDETITNLRESNFNAS